MKIRLLRIITAILLGIAVFFFPVYPSLSSREPIVILKKIIEFGPRPSGSKGLEKVRKYMIEYLSKRGFKVTEDSFVSLTPYGKKKFTNLHLLIPSSLSHKNNKKIILAAHYDSKFFKDIVFLGVNDSAASCALLMSMAEKLRDEKYNFDLEIVFFDGEEAFVRWSESDGLYGSRYYVNKMKRQNRLGEIKGLILIDMIGDRNLDIDYEISSSPFLRKVMVQAAENKKLREIFSGDEKYIEDDHTPFIKEGIPAINIIDFNYDYWHTSEDSIDKVSAQSLASVAELIFEMLNILNRKK